ncbi:MAG TPA: hypothetical protein VNW68_02340 [Candidatus Limnocylindria bacterium]|jgi:hypothetical protein|nr:hypothetical protein [Candidatus Limnocylindria bacterium]
MERLKRAGIVFAVLLTGLVVVAMIQSFHLLIATPIALFGSIFLGALMVWVILKAALVPERRYVGWARSVAGPNGRWLMLLLIIVWGAGMTFLASLGLGPQEMGAPAFIGLFVGIFLFMGFIWSVIGE